MMTMSESRGRTRVGSEPRHGVGCVCVGAGACGVCGVVGGGYGSTSGLCCVCACVGSPLTEIVVISGCHPTYRG